MYLPVKTKYSTNENCRNNICEKPHKQIVCWCLQNIKQTTVKELYSWKEF